jgi:predicted transposase/invertase (TIGR01784 family)
MKTDKLFYRLFISQPRLIAELIPEIPIDCEFTYSAPVIKEKGFAIDGLLTPIGDNLSLPMVFLEAQMQKDARFYARYFAEVFLYLHQYEVVRPWYGLLILPNRNVDIGSDIPYQALLSSQIKQIYLEDLLELPNLSPNLALLKLLVVNKTEAVVLAQSILQTAATQAEFRQRLDLVEAILVNKFPQLSTKEILTMLDLKTADIKETRFYQEILQVGLSEGRLAGTLEGKIEGKIEGRQEEAIAIVMRLLNRRCGALSSSLENQVRSLSVNQLEVLGEALLDFQGIRDLETWLINM